MLSRKQTRSFVRAALIALTSCGGTVALPPPPIDAAIEASPDVVDASPPPELDAPDEPDAACGVLCDPAVCAYDTCAHAVVPQPDACLLCGCGCPDAGDASP